MCQLLSPNISPFHLFFAAPTVNSINETNQAGSMRHQSIFLRCLWTEQTQLFVYILQAKKLPQPP